MAWCRDHLAGDATLLDRCVGSVLDVGCGPGRLTAALNTRGNRALGIDTSAAAVRLARRRGANAVRRDVFDPVPGNGRWRHVLLADGNIGIGGDPLRLLRRCRELLEPGGHLHAEVTAPGGGRPMVRDPDAELTPEPFRGARRIIDPGAALLRRPLPAPRDALRRGPLKPGAFSSRLRSTRLTSQVGIALAVAFTICFVTGLFSHFMQHPPGWMGWPSRPVGLYRFTQGLHVATGLACIPLLGVKLWSVYPRLFAWPPARDVVHAIERAAVAVLVAAALSR
jgi:Methyltransferase domain